MANETVITVIGNLTADPELRYTQGGAAVANFTVASTPRVFDKQANEWEDGEALFLRASAWRDLGENVASSLHKGDRVVVQGELRQRSYEKDGQKRSVIELHVIEVGASLRHATAQMSRINRQQGQSGANNGSAGGGGSTPIPTPQNATQRPATNATQQRANNQPAFNEETPF
ncbi:single-stranded DNA-binding protein [Mycetocola reblochoni]|uniref:Single-stranded DNA-binding protein n=2 Tax=Mycetocola reblochoni TaxID=331618 RepID=A0A1R4IXU8_9MICO|nr:single-stranded DNA-binding protein [Mycetocola reblochoni]RLP70888.1 single-stranded DNA-binding protein [Mycetocola reblochoni]SJN24716.1 Single-stranded DNA-binding protein [Mycetocola reblochoni REB411]